MKRITRDYADWLSSRKTSNKNRHKFIALVIFLLLVCTITVTVIPLTIMHGSLWDSSADHYNDPGPYIPTMTGKTIRISPSSHNSSRKTTTRSQSISTTISTRMEIQNSATSSLSRRIPNQVHFSPRQNSDEKSRISGKSSTSNVTKGGTGTNGAGTGLGKGNKGLGIGSGEREYLSKLNPCKYTESQLVGLGFPRNLRPRPVAGAVDINDHYHGIVGWIHAEHDKDTVLPMIADVCNYNQTGSNDTINNKNLWIGKLAYLRTQEPVSLKDYPIMLNDFIGDGICNTQTNYTITAIQGYPALIGRSFNHSKGNNQHLICYQVYVAGVSFAVMGMQPSVSSSDERALDKLVATVLAEEMAVRKSTQSNR